MCTYANFFPPYFSCPFCRFSIFVFLAFSFVFSTLSRKWRRTLFVLELRHLFLRYSVHLVKEIVKLLKKSERWENKWSKVKTLQDKPRSRWPVFFYKLCEKCYRKSCKYMRNNSTRLKGKKKTSKRKVLKPLSLSSLLSVSILIKYTYDRCIHLSITLHVDWSPGT